MGRRIVVIEVALVGNAGAGNVVVVVAAPLSNPLPLFFFLSFFT